MLIRNWPVADMPLPQGDSEKGHSPCQGLGPTATHLPPCPPACPDPRPLPAPVQDWMPSLAGPAWVLPSPQSIPHSSRDPASTANMKLTIPARP